MKNRNTTPVRRAGKSEVNGEENYGNNGAGPVWWYPMEKMYCDDNRPTDEELEQMKKKLLVELDKLI